MTAGSPADADLPLTRFTRAECRPPGRGPLGLFGPDRRGSAKGLTGVTNIAAALRRHARERHRPLATYKIT